MSNLSANREMALLKTMFNWATEDEQGFVKENPVRKIKMFSEKDTARKRTLSRDEEERLFAELSPYMKPLVLVALHTGLRIGEVLALKWTDIDFHNWTVTAEHTKDKEARVIRLNPLL